MHAIETRPDKIPAPNIIIITDTKTLLVINTPAESLLGCRVVAYGVMIRVDACVEEVMGMGNVSLVGAIVVAGAVVVVVLFVGVALDIIVDVVVGVFVDVVGNLFVAVNADVVVGVEVIVTTNVAVGVVVTVIVDVAVSVVVGVAADVDVLVRDVVSVADVNGFISPIFKVGEGVVTRAVRLLLGKMMAGAVETLPGATVVGYFVNTLVEERYACLGKVAREVIISNVVSLVSETVINNS